MYWHSGETHSNKDIQRVTEHAKQKGRASLSSVSKIHRDLLSFSCLALENPPEVSRGAAKLEDILEALKASTYDDINVRDLDSLACSAKEADVTRLSLPERAGIVSPVEVLKDPELSDFMTMPFTKAKSGRGCRNPMHFREIFGGKGGLERAFIKSQQWIVGPSLEAYKKVGEHTIYIREQDILQGDVYSQLIADARSSSRCYWHFGIPCDSFSILINNLNGGTRSATIPGGSGLLSRESRGNEILRRSCYLINILHKRGCYWSVENPSSSWLWRMPCMKRLALKHDVESVTFDQCMYELLLPTPEGKQHCRKTTRIVGNLPSV